MNGGEKYWYLLSGRSALAEFLRSRPLVRTMWFQLLWTQCSVTAIGLLIGLGSSAEVGLTMLIGSLCASLLLYCLIWVYSLMLGWRAQARLEAEVDSVIYRIIYEADEDEEGR